jgi:hypothetical protein
LKEQITSSSLPKHQNKCSKNQRQRNNEEDDKKPVAAIPTPGTISK